jgi:lipopolysaccharide export system protein LptA
MYRNRMTFPNRILAQVLGRLTLTALIGTISTAALALPDDRSQPVRITADSAVQENTTVTYRGKVVVIQGSLRVDADQVVVNHVAGKVQKIIATGKPAHFQQQPEVNGGIVKATATTLVYYQAENRFELLTDAFVERDGSSIAGDKIEYSPTTQAVHATGGPGRVNMVLPPELGDDKPPALPTPVPASGGK